MEANFQVQIGQRDGVDLGAAAEHPRRDAPPLLLRTVVAAAVAATIDLGLFGAASMLWGVPSGFAMLTPILIVVAAAAASSIAGVGLATLRLLTRRAELVFLVMLALTTLLSLAGPFQAMAGAMPRQPRATLATGTTMIVLHFLTAGVIAAVLLRRTSGGR